MATKGVKQSPEHVAKRVAAWQNSAARAKAAERLTALNKERSGVPLSASHRAKQSAKAMGKQYALGTKRDEAFRRKLSDYWAAHREEHNHYRDGKGGERANARVAEMGRLDYRLWRNAVFERDDWTCQHCKVRGGVLHADHIKPYVTHPDLRLDVNNGRTLCAPCHRKTDTYGSKARKAA